MTTAGPIRLIHIRQAVIAADTEENAMMKSNRKASRQSGFSNAALAPIALVFAGITIYSVHRVEMEQAAIAGLEAAPMAMTLSAASDPIAASFDRDLNHEASAAGIPGIQQTDSVATLIRDRLLHQHYNYQ